MELQDRTVLVTGATVRLGRATALEFGRLGARVVVHAMVEDDAAGEVVGELQGQGTECLLVTADQRDEQQIERACDLVRDRFGGVDVLVNNAASWEATPLGVCSPADFDDAIATNLRGPWLWARRLGLEMKRSGGGAIVSMGDTTSTRPAVDYIPYSIAKAGLRTMTAGLAKALAPEVRVSMIEPGPVLFPDGFPEHEQQAVLDATLLKRLVRVEDIVRAIIYLATADSVTGEIHAVDAGTFHRI